MKLFRHTASEPGLWRGWIKNGQSLELSKSRAGWQFGAGVLIHSDDDDNGSRMIWLAFWRWQAFIPIGIAKGPFDVGEEPKWTVSGDYEFGFTVQLGHARKNYDWPWALTWYRTSRLLVDGTWFHDTAKDVRAWRKNLLPGARQWRDVSDQYEGLEWTADLPYSYMLRSGEVQERTATVKVQEMEWRRRFWPFARAFAKIRKSIDVHFSGEVGERSGSWKGGCIGCYYEMRDGETPAQTLARMQAERVF